MSGTLNSVMIVITEQGVEYDIAYDSVLGDYVCIDLGDVVCNLTIQDLRDMLKELES